MSSVLRSGASFIVLASALLLAACGGGSSNNSNSSSSTKDTTPPVLSLPSNQTAAATGPSGAVVTFTATATDNVDGTDPVTCTPASGSTFPIGATTVNCSATDKAGNTANGSFTVTVTDTTPPVLSLPGNQTATATSASGAAVTFNATATDIVDGTDSVTCTPASGSTFAIGTATVNCSATDKAGNTAHGSFTVTVSAPSTPPTLSLSNNQTVPATSPSGSTVTFSASATDVLDGTDPVTCAPASGSLFALGTTTVNCSATNQAGHTAHGSFTVTVPRFWISAGYGHTCSTDATTGYAYCWGENTYGQLGDGSDTKATSSLIAQQVLSAASTDLTGVVTVSASEEVTCALISGGTGECWGEEEYGQLGNDVSASTNTKYPYATQVVGQGDSGFLTGISAIENSATLDGQFSCALITGGTVQCWGYNLYGQLGDGVTGTSSSSQPTPVSVLDATTGQPLTAVVSVAAGGQFACALINDGTVRCWGDNGFGELGYGYTDPVNGPQPGETNEAASPVVIDNTATAAGSTPLTGVVAITAGTDFACALINNGTVQCWGENTTGALGNGVTLTGYTVAPDYNPVTVITSAGTALSDVTALSAGTESVCALLSTGAVDCWGDDTFGQLGNNVVTTDSAEDYSTAGPVLTNANGTPLTGVVAISTGGESACATTSNGTAAVCWGSDSYGQLGDGASGLGSGTVGAGGNSALPVAVVVLPP